MDADKSTPFVFEPDLRSNSEVESAVTRGIAAALLNGVSEGVRVMMNEGVPNRIILRVLSSESKRRATDWKSCT